MKKKLEKIIWLLARFKNSSLLKFTWITSDSFVSNKSKLNKFIRFYNSSIERYSYVGERSRVVNSDIGAFCSISWNCQIGLSSHSMKFLSTSPIFTEKKNGTGFSWIGENILDDNVKRTIIGNDVWIGSGSIILEGVIVGDGSIIGAGSIVTKNIPPYSVAVGIPARVIRKRFSDEVCNLLMKINWWNFDDEKLKKLMPIFQTEYPNIELLSKIDSN